VEVAGASRALRAAIGSPIPRPDLARFDVSAAATELALGAERFGAARARGEAMDAAQAMALARAAGGAGPAGGTDAGAQSGHSEEE
jgi:hypothetical protein